MKKESKYNLKDLKNIPSEPGIYKMLNSKGRVIYIGKARNLRKRVASYFTKKDPYSFKTTILVSQINNIDIIVTKSEHEAFILENQLIKHFKPKYNIQLKDDKNYPYIKITTDEDFPRIIITRKKEKDAHKYFGPYPSIGSSKRLIKLLNEIFLLRTCTKNIDLKNIQPKCIQLDLEKCLGPCQFKDAKAYYDEQVINLKLLLSGKNQLLISKLKKEMQKLSKDLEFEKAAAYRDKLLKIEMISQRQIIEINSKKIIHLLAVAENNSYYYLIIQKIIEGKLLYQNGIYTKKQADLDIKSFFIESVYSFYEHEIDFPDEIICELEFAMILESIPKCRIISPQKGIKKELLESTQKNAKLALMRISKNDINFQINEGQALLCLQNILDLPKIPESIIGFDISHYYGQDIVGSAVYFLKTKPLKKKYRQYKIKSLNENKSNDPEAIFEIVLRRIYKSLEEDDLPDLLLIDGGKAQLNYCYKALKSLPIKKTIQIIALAKKNEEIYTLSAKMPLSLDKDNKGLQFLERVRDEAHRFAISLQKKKRKKPFQDTILHSIPGLGEKRINLLYNKFKTIENIKKADPVKLARIGRIGIKLAQTIIKILE